MTRKKSLIMAVTMLIACMPLVACSSETKPGSSANPKATNTSSSDSTIASAPTKIKALAILFGQTPSTNNKAQADLEQRGNVKLEVDFVPGDAYSDKMNVALSSGHSYDLILWTDPIDKFQKLVKQGAFHEITPYLQGQKNLNLIPTATLQGLQVDGKNYGIPRPRGLYGGGLAHVVIRKDWLDAYQLPLPQTLDEFYHDLQIFKKKDPVGGGKTIPLTLSNEVDWNPPFNETLPFTFAFGLPYGYKVEGNKAVAAIQAPQYKLYLDWLKQLWSEQLVDLESPIIKSQQSVDKFLAGTAGAIVSNASLMSDLYLDKLKKADPKANPVFIPVLTGPKGDKGVIVTTGFYGIWAIPSSVPKDKVQSIVNFLNFSANEDNFHFAKTGVIGVHSNGYIDGVVHRTPEQTNVFNAERPDQWVLENRYDPYIYANSTRPEVLAAQKSALDAISTIGIENPFIFYASSTLAKTPDHLKNVNEAMLKYVMGESTYEGVQNQIDAWSKGVGSSILKEYMDQYTAAHK
ncbi:extracellular solute-binding protein [Paenibacillus sp. HWE-109]|uniref:extracellular solute-binding protein n=1 Tax=Paenibacillus sp. HWE-109 TaxID=1306526 RepID=UPI001EDDC34E|nr:extracellular solute-binding protein [Paenibacillus sp. HWE-109]UKS28763.1 extracellular solute-binding protein [Paenibacillus sp. HWE-109]